MLAKLYSVVIGSMQRMTSNEQFKSILDIGTEDSDYLKAVQSVYKCNVQGLNIMGGFEHYDRKQTGITIYNGVNIPFPDNSFDMITIYSVLHHVHPSIMELFIANICRVASKYILIKDYNAGPSPKQRQYQLECIIQHEIFEGILNKVSNPMEPMGQCNCLIDPAHFLLLFK